MTTEMSGAPLHGFDAPPPEVGEPLGLIAQLDQGFRDHDGADAFALEFDDLPRIVCIRHPEDIRRVLVDPEGITQKEPAFNGVRRVLGESLLDLETADKRWAQIHEPAARAFRRQHIISDNTLGIIADAGNTFIDGLLSRNAGKINDLEREMTALTAHTLRAVVLGRHANVGLGRLTHEEFQDISTTIAAAGGDTLPEGVAADVARLNGRLGELALETLTVATKEGADPGTLLADLINTGLDEQAILNALSTVMFAGRETTGITLTWKEQLLKNRPDILEQLRQEAQTVLQDGRPFTREVFHELKYTRALIEELVRFMPPTPFIPRSPTEEIHVGGVVVHPGNLVISSVFHAHRHRDYWDSPELLIPARFSAGNQDTRFRKAYMPFGLGERNCVGRNVAVVEMIVHTALLAKRVKMQVVSGRVASTFDVALRPDSPIQVELEATPAAHQSK